MSILGFIVAKWQTELEAERDESDLGPTRRPHSLVGLS